MISRLLLLAAILLLLTPLHAQDEADLDVLLDRLATYLQTYEGALSTLVADEQYVQDETRYLDASGQRRTLPSQRVTEGEVLFLRLPGELEWFGVRDISKVDGRPVEGARLTLSDLTKASPDQLLERAAEIVRASSQHNLGGRRTINMPTVPLEALSARNHVRYIFKVGRATRIGGVRVRLLEFHEFDEPTLVRASDGGNLWTRGTAWISPTTGAIWRAELIVGPDRPGAFRRTALESRIRVEFALDKRLELLVPKELSETFWIPNGFGRGRGRYSNFRKFATTARIVP
jgi:hypothetical protein